MANTMQSVFDATPDLIWAVDREDKLLFFNEAVREYMLREHGAHATIGTYNTRHLWDSQFWLAQYQQVFEQGARKFEYETSKGR